MASEIHLEYEPTKIQIISISQGIFQNSQNSIFLYEINSDSGLIQINTTLLDSKVVINRGNRLSCKDDSKTTSVGIVIEFNNDNIFIDPENRQINVLEKISGTITHGTV